MLPVSGQTGEVLDIMIRAIIFDLDNCLSASEEAGADLFEPALAAIRSENRGTLSEEALEAALRDTWRHSLDFVARKHGFSKAMLDAGWRAFASLETKALMHGYEDIAVLAEIPAMRFLVTTGFRRLQESKIRALGFAHLFQAVVVDAIDEPDRKGKQGIFAEILQTHNLAPAEALVVGDNPDSEIEAGNRLGIKTVQILRPGVPFGDSATYHVRSLSEVRDLVTGNARTSPANT